MKTITPAAPLTFSLWLFWLLVCFFSSPFLTLNHTQTLTATSIMYFPSKGLLFPLLLLLSHHILSGGLGFSSRTQTKTRLSHYEIRCVNLSSWIRCFRKCTTLSNRNAFAKTINTAIKPAPFPTKKKRNVLFHMRDISIPAHIQKGVFHLRATCANLHVSWWIRWTLSCFAMSSRYIYIHVFNKCFLTKETKKTITALVACNRNTLNLCFASHLWIKCVLSQSLTTVDSGIFPEASRSSRGSSFQVW